MDISDYIEKLKVNGEDVEDGKNPINDINWIDNNIGSTNRLWYSVCYGNDKFVAVTSTAFAYSSDGITWSESTISDTSRSWRSVCYGNDKFVAVEYNSNYFAYSSDGITWTESTISDNIQYSSVCYGNDKFVAISMSYFESASMYMYSSDGINWINGGSLGVEDRWGAICYGDKKFVIVGNTRHILYSSNFKPLY